MKLAGDIYLLGDIHGAFRGLFALLEHRELHDCTIICVGDIAFGFPHYDEKAAKSYNEWFSHRNIKFLSIRGNHDDKEYFDGRINLSHFKLLPDYTRLEVNGENWLLVGGAISIDRTDRKEGVSYWKSEPFVLDPSKVGAEKVDVLITHSGPSWVGPRNKVGIVSYYVDKEGEKLWNELLEERKLHEDLYELTKPKRWFLGHFHETSYGSFEGCRARILGIEELLRYEA